MRRAERLTTELASREPVNPVALQYPNRLSDHLFVLGRHLNDQGAADVLWAPGATGRGARALPWPPDSSSRNAFAASRSAVPKPSLNQS